MFRENIVSPKPTVKRLRQVYLALTLHVSLDTKEVLLCGRVVKPPKASPGAVSAVLIDTF